MRALEQGEKRGKSAVRLLPVVLFDDEAAATSPGDEVVEMETRRAVVTAALAALVFGGITALPAAHGATVAQDRAAPAATAPAPLTFEHVTSWGGTGSGFGKHLNPRGLDFYDGTYYVTDSGSHTLETEQSGSGSIWNATETPSTGLGGFDLPYDVAVANDEILYVADAGNNRVQRLERFTWTSWGSFGTATGRFNFPIALDVAPGGHVYVADWGNNRVQELTASGTFVRSWGGSGDGPGQYRDLVGIAVAPDGSVYTTDNILNRVTKFTALGAYVRHWNNGGSSPTTGARSVDVAPDGTVYVTDGTADVVNAYSPSGVLLGTLGAGLLSDPWGVDVGVDGYVRVTDLTLDTVETYRPVLAASAAPTVSGTAKVGKTLRTTKGAWPVPDVVVAYQWLRGGKAIKGATGVTYKLEAADAGQRVTVRVTATRADYPAASSATSKAVKVAKIAPKVSTKLVKKSVKVGAKAKLKVTVTVKGVAKPTGKLRIYDGKKRIKTVSLKAKGKGKVVVVLPRLKAGKHKVKVTYLGTTQIAKKSSAAKTLTVKR